MTVKFSTAQLRAVHERLAQAQAGLDDKLEALVASRAEVFQRAAAAGDLMLRQQLAKQLLLLDRHSRLLQAQQAMTERQVQLIGRLVYAREQAEVARQLEESATTTGADWLEALTLAAAARRDLDRRLSLVDGLLEWLAGLVPSQAAPLPGPAIEWATVARVPDGDGAVLADGRRVRYLGIDAPEMELHGRPEPYAREAKELNHSLVAGRRVRLERDQSEADHYGRLLRYVWAGDTLVNAELVRQGAAYAFPVPPDTLHQALLTRLEQEAHRARRGLWHTEQS